MPRNYEFKAYPGNSDGDVAAQAITSTGEFEETASAKAYAGRMAKRINGPVDIAFVNSQEWNARYITTAMPSDYTASGYRLERLD